MAAAMCSYSSACLLRRTKTLFSLPRLSGGWRLSSDSTSTKTLPTDGTDASVIDANNEGPVKTSEPSPSSSSTTASVVAGNESTLSKFVRAVELWDEKQDDNAISEEITKKKPGPLEEQGQPTTFASMLRNSKLFQLGHPAGRMVVGRIIEVHGDDLYIDLGGKFHCVCKTPQVKPHEYRRGIQVKLLLQDLEMSAAFLGSSKHITLLEADATLIGLRRNPSSS